MIAVDVEKAGDAAERAQNVALLGILKPESTLLPFGRFDHLGQNQRWLQRIEHLVRIKNVGNRVDAGHEDIRRIKFGISFRTEPRHDLARPAGGVLHRDAKTRGKFRDDLIAHHGIRRARHHHRAFLLGRFDCALPLCFVARL